MKLLGLTVKNYVNFKNAFLPLDHIGVTKITGKNLDSNTKLAPAGDDTNAVGKTALMSGIPQLAFASNPMTQEIKTKAKKDVFKRKDASISLTVETNDSKEYTLEKRSNGKSTQFVIHKGSENTNARTQAYPEEKIRQMFDMTEDEFYTLWFISSSKPSKIQYGSASSRLQFFTNFFRLNNYDDVRKIFNGMLREAKDAKIALAEVITQIDGLNNKDTEYLKDLKKKLVKVQKKAEKYSQEYSDLHALEIDLAFLQDSRDLFKRWEKLVGKNAVSTAKEVKKLVSKAESVVSQAANFEAYAVKQKVYEKEKTQYKEKKEKYETQLKTAVVGKVKPKDFSKERDALLRAISKLENKLEEKQVAFKKLSKSSFDLDEYDAAREKIKGCVYKDLSEAKEKAGDDYAVAISNKNSLKKLVKHSNCPTCSHRIDKNLSKKLYRKASKEAEKYSRLIAGLGKILSDYDAFKLLDKAKVEHEEAAKEAHSLEKNIKALSKELKGLKAEQEVLLAWEPYFLIEAKLNSLEKPTKPEAPKDFTYSSKEIEYNKSLVSVGPLVLPNFERYYTVKCAKVEMTLDEVKARSKYLRTKMEENNALIPKLTSKIELTKQALKDYERLSARKAELKASASDADVLEMLVDAYSNKGLKLLLIKHIASVIEKNMNQYASLVYPEDVKFKFEVVNDREFNILRGRKRGKKVEYDDVRVLSGAESRAFSFLLPLAIMPLIPKDRRLNVMVLDEPTNNMGSARMELFVKNFVPKLNQLVPHLVIISTSDEVYANSVSYQIVKKDGKSTLNKI